MSDLQKKLSDPFPPRDVHWRIGSTTADKTKGMALAYIDSRDVMERLDSVCGLFGWSIRHDIAENGKVTAHIAIKNPETGEWVSKSDGAGATDVEGDKGSYSDATKRAAVVWGIGRYLYDMKNVWVKLAPQGKSYKIDDSEYPRLESLLKTSQKPEIHKIDPDLKKLAKDFSQALSIAPNKDLFEKCVLDNAKLTDRLAKEWPECHKQCLATIETKRKELEAKNV